MNNIENLRHILGFYEENKNDEDGNEYILDHNPIYELMGASIDLKRTNADPICIDTIERVMKRLIDFDKATRS